MLLHCWPEAVVIAAWIVGIFLLFRVSAFRIDRPDHRGYFGLPYFWNTKYFDPGNFTPDGRQLLYWSWFVGAIFALGAVLSVLICV
jgi:hypothetical protein